MARGLWVLALPSMKHHNFIMENVDRFEDLSSAAKSKSETQTCYVSSIRAHPRVLMYLIADVTFCVSVDPQT
jgi:hypothetical protein